MLFRYIYHIMLSTACFQCHENYATESRLRNHLEQHRNEEGKLTPGCAIDGMEAAFCHLIAGLLLCARVRPIWSWSILLLCAQLILYVNNTELILLCM